MFFSDTKRHLDIPKNSDGRRHSYETHGPKSLEKDLVNNPEHYTKGIETIHYIKSWGMSYEQGNVVKYVSRYNLKHDTKEQQIQDLKKALWYLQDMIKDLEALPPIPNPY